MIGLRTGQPDLSIVKNLAGLSIAFSTEPTPTATISPLPATIPTLPSATIAPTFTPAPTNTPVPVRLAVRRIEIQSLFINLGFSFQGTTPLDNQPRVIGRSIDKSISVELVGAADSITKITLIAGESNIGDQDMIVMVYMTRLLQRALPDWGDAKDWLQFGLKQISDSPDPEANVVTTTGNTRISLKLVKNMKLTFLSIEGESSPETPGATPITQAP